jgi:hypothetical protein
MSVPAKLGQCTNLHTLKVRGCEALSALPEEILHCSLLSCIYGDGIHETVESPLWSTLLGIAVKANSSLAHHADSKGRRAIDHAHPECMRAMRAALLFMGRYNIDGGVALAHISRTCAVAFARDMHGTKHVVSA